VIKIVDADSLEKEFDRAIGGSRTRSCDVSHVEDDSLFLKASKFIEENDLQQVRVGFDVYGCCGFRPTNVDFHVNKGEKTLVLRALKDDFNASVWTLYRALTKEIADESKTSGIAEVVFTKDDISVDLKIQISRSVYRNFTVFGETKK
jgi:hypothetical protein